MSQSTRLKRFIEVSEELFGPDVNTPTFLKMLRQGVPGFAEFIDSEPVTPCEPAKQPDQFTAFMVVNYIPPKRYNEKTNDISQMLLQTAIEFRVPVGILQRNGSYFVVTPEGDKHIVS